MSKMEKATDELFRRMLSDAEVLHRDLEFALDRLCTVGEGLDSLQARLARLADREPRPGDGPDYHEDHRAWERRQRG